MEDKNQLKKSAKELTDISTKHWQLIPHEVKIVLKKHIDVLNIHFSEIAINEDLLPNSWSQEKDVIDALKNYLSYLKKTGRTITNELIKACISDIYLTAKDDVNLVIKSYNYSTIRQYLQPYVPKESVSQLMTINALPSQQEVKEVFLANFKGQIVSDKLISFFMSFNNWANDNLQPIAGKQLYSFIKDLAKVTEYHTGKVFTTLKYMHFAKTINVPTDYSPILNWAKKQK